jgi:hypothetical protein
MSDKLFIHDDHYFCLLFNKKKMNNKSSCSFESTGEGFHDANRLYFWVDSCFEAEYELRREDFPQRYRNLQEYIDD